MSNQAPSPFNWSIIGQSIRLTPEELAEWFRPEPYAVDGEQAQDSNSITYTGNANCRQVEAFLGPDLGEVKTLNPPLYVITTPGGRVLAHPGDTIIRRDGQLYVQKHRAGRTPAPAQPNTQ